MKNIYKNYVNEKYDNNGVLSEFSLNVPEKFNFAYDIVDRLASEEPDRLAMIWCGSSGEERRFTFGDIKRESDRTAAFLQSLGIKKGDMVMLMMRRHYEFWYSIIALHKIGAVAIPAAVSLTTKDLEYRFNAAGIHAVICTGRGTLAQSVDEAQLNSPSLRIKIMVQGKRDGWLDFDEGVRSAGETFQKPAGLTISDPMLLYFTSGTSAQPKMVLHDFSYPLAHIVTARHWQHINPEGVHLSVSDTGWAKAAWGKLYGQWIMEAAIFVYDFDEFYPNDLLEKIARFHITTFCAPPTVYRYFIKQGLGGYDLSSLEYATTAGEALNPEVYRRFYEMTGLRLMEGFGQTETTLTIGNLFGSEPKLGSMGKPSPLYDIELMDKDGRLVEDGNVGEIIIRTHGGKQPGLCTGYYNDPKLTAAAWRDGVFHTGDTAWKDSDGYYWYIGRVDDLIKSSGFRISPFEIESVLMEHPAVLECAVTGVPDSRRGQSIKASIILTKEYEPSRELTKLLKEFVKKQTAHYKCPRIIDFVQSLPKTNSGKIRRVEIRDRDVERVKKHEAGVYKHKKKS